MGIFKAPANAVLKSSPAIDSPSLSVLTADHLIGGKGHGQRAECRQGGILQSLEGEGQRAPLGEEEQLGMQRVQQSVSLCSFGTEMHDLPTSPCAAHAMASR